MVLSVQGEEVAEKLRARMTFRKEQFSAAKAAPILLDFYGMTEELDEKSDFIAESTRNSAGAKARL